MNDINIQVTAFGETHEIACHVLHDAQRIESIGRVVVGRFPTGSKLHRSTLTLWKRTSNMRGETAATLNGDEYVADGTLYIHNSNKGRIVGWDTEALSEAVIGRWN